jgi:hypothetical protein
MKRLILDLAILLAVVLGNCLAADRTDAIAIAPVRTVTAERGVVPPGSSVIVLTEDKVKTGRASRGTVYFASTATDLVDETGAVLIPRGSPIELVVRSVAWLNPGGVGTLLTLDIHAITVRGVRYPVETDDKRPEVHGVGVDRDSAMWIGGTADAVRGVITRGQSINVPTGILLAFTTQAPIRLQGFQR